MTFLVATHAPVCAQPQLPSVDLKPALPEGSPTLDVNSDEYTLGPGDVISITDVTSSIDGRPVTSSSMVLPDGTVSLYPVGLVKARGKTLRSLTEEVRVRYQAIAKDPEFILGISQTRPVEVYVLGEVMNPGRYRGDKDRGEGPGQTLLSAVPFSGPSGQTAPTPKTRSQVLDYLLPFSPVAAGIGAAIGAGSAPAAPTQTGRTRYSDSARVLAPTTLTCITALQLAGGVKETADIKRVQVRRKGQPPMEVNLFGLLVDGDASNDVVLKPDDVVIVPKGTVPFKAEDLGMVASQSRVIKVFGAVRVPGIYELAPQDDVLSIVSRAGGFTETAVTRKVWLSRKLTDGRTITSKVSIGRSMKHFDYVGRKPLVSGDVVEVKESIVKKTAPRTLTIVGAFASAFLILYASRRIVDKSQPAQTSTTLTQNNAGPLGLPSVF
ncbi:MAG: SLBB domain-containing protein [Candidatus Obscuribacterales bacterium]|nr:SLBB domain-containing protein [Candidatus Obscuribacterales bacterium]